MKRIEIRNKQEIVIVNANNINISCFLCDDDDETPTLIIGNHIARLQKCKMEELLILNEQLEDALKEIDHFIYEDDSHNKLIVDLNEDRVKGEDGYCVVKLVVLHPMDIPPFKFDTDEVSVSASCATTWFNVKVPSEDRDVYVIAQAKEKLRSLIGDVDFDDAEILERVDPVYDVFYARTYYPNNN